MCLFVCVVCVRVCVVQCINFSAPSSSSPVFEMEKILGSSSGTEFTVNVTGRN